MVNEKKAQMMDALKRGMAVATGCTEPVAIAYAGAVARKYAVGEIEKIRLIASANMIKNAFVVGIPGTSLTGLKYAVAIGCMCTRPERKLSILENLTQEQAQKAKALVDAGKVALEKSALAYKLYIEVQLRTLEDEVTVTIVGAHTNVTKIVKNGKVLYHGGCEEEKKGPSEEAYEFDLKDVFEFCTLEAGVEDGALAKQAICLNRSIAEEGLRVGYGLEVGRMLQKNIQRGWLAGDLANHAMMMAAAASDARMAGVNLPVMSNSGSGNQGIAATMPVVAVWERLDFKDEEKLWRAVLLSNLATIYIKRKFGVLSALCGAVVAASGAACGIVYLMGGGFRQVENAVHNTLGNVAGMVCDGAKSSCALKLSTCANAAVQAALLAMNNLRIGSHEGIVEQFSEQTIENFAVLGNEGSEKIDGLILDMILHKKIEGK